MGLAVGGGIGVWSPLEAWGAPGGDRRGCIWVKGQVIGLGQWGQVCVCVCLVGCTRKVLVKGEENFTFYLVQLYTWKKFYHNCGLIRKKF